MTADVHIELAGVGMSFGANRVLDDISFELRRGQIGVFIGGSGAGKTTLLRIIIGLLRPTAGMVRIDGKDIATLSRRELQAARAHWAMVFQYSALLDSLTVLENVTLPLAETRQLSAAEVRERGSAMLASLELDGTEARYPSELSGGMRKRVALARALIREPSLIVYDEPASGLDPLSARHVDDMILRARERYGVTSVVISHDMAQAAKLADQAYVLERGRLVAHGPLAQLRSAPGSLAQRFFDASRIG
jgi:phospholipid/cholesterol/gamma-HCH transport system ATP-binding protein